MADEHRSDRAHVRAEVGHLVEEVYGELRRLADRYVHREQARSVQATELVHEAYLRLAKDAPAHFADRAHFVAIAAISMRRLLVERARARRAVKRGGIQVQVTLDEGLLATDPSSAIDLIALDRALDGLARLDPQQARIVELRYFGGLSVEETAAALDISPATVKRHWTVARAWLLRAIEGEDAR
jgi:RNA polymerase sigma-70 factor (ECF subfamily)